MTPEQLDDVLRTGETSHVELVDVLLDAIQAIDECIYDLPHEPDMELTRAVLAATCMSWTPDDDDNDDDNGNDVDPRWSARLFAQRIETAVEVFNRRWRGWPGDVRVGCGCGSSACFEGRDVLSNAATTQPPPSNE